MNATRFLTGLALASVLSAPAWAGDTTLTLKDHKFTPAELHVKANQATTIQFVNNDDTAEEFDSTALKVEKVVGGHSQGNVHIRALAPGKYPFMGEYHTATAQGVVIAE
ncbi:MAG TPA: cupredoxin domain-containing protein [Rhizomicrobium sp.]|jgi:plastocyanin